MTTPSIDTLFFKTYRIDDRTPEAIARIIIEDARAMTSFCVHYTKVFTTEAGPISIDSQMVELTTKKVYYLEKDAFDALQTLSIHPEAAVTPLHAPQEQHDLLFFRRSFTYTFGTTFKNPAWKEKITPLFDTFVEERKKEPLHPLSLPKSLRSQYAAYLIVGTAQAHLFNHITPEKS
jgi:hypothetical protein